MKVYKSVSEIIGNTPLLLLSNLMKIKGAKANVYAKLEFMNPAGSVKDRVAREMIEDYERRGVIDKNTVIIEPTSGNTGIGLASICASKGYKLVLTMPETMSEERRLLLKAYGAEIVLTDGALGMTGAIKKAQEIKENTSNSIIAGQFTNPSNPEAHRKTTGPEIWNDLGGKVDIFVAGVGTGGTLTGVGEYLKSKNKNVKVVAVEPLSSPVLSKGYSGSHAIQGIGAGFVPDTLNVGVFDEIIAVKNEDAFSAANEVAKTEGFLTGISAGAALYAAFTLANRKENEGKNIVVLLPDTGDRYLSTGLFK